MIEDRIDDIKYINIPGADPRSQTDPNRCLRFDAGKPRIDLIPARFMFELAKVYTFGSEKYEDWNWTKGTSWGRCFGAMLRHLYKWAGGEDVDPESGCLHLAHAAFWIAALIEWRQIHPDFDDRYKGGWE